MLWQVRAVLDDRPGSLAAIAAACGERAANILTLQIFPAVDGRVVDEMIVHTPGGWSAEDVAGLFTTAGVDDPSVRSCSPQALEDQPVRYLRAARTVAQAPELLEEQLCRLLEAAPAEAAEGQALLELEDEQAPTVRLVRRDGFTDTEVARARELQQVALAAHEVDGRPAPVPGNGPDVVLRTARPDDVDALVAMHARCSAETVHRRFHVPLPRLSPRRARDLLVPEGGVSVVASVGDAVVAIGMIASVDDGMDLAVMVEDRWQRRGLGARIVRLLAEEAARRGHEMLTCAVQPDNSAAPRTLRGAGLRALVSVVDGVAEYHVRVDDLLERPRRRVNRPAMGEVTTPLVALLHGRSELRDVYAPADFLDQAVRGGA